MMQDIRQPSREPSYEIWDANDPVNGSIASANTLSAATSTMKRLQQEEPGRNLRVFPTHLMNTQQIRRSCYEIADCAASINHRR